MDGDIFTFRLFLQNGHFCFNIRDLNIGNQPPFKSGSEALFEIWDILWKFIAGDDNLFPGLMKRFEGMKEFSLRPFLAGNKLDIIDEENIHFSKFISELIHLFKTKGINQFVRKFLC